MPESSARDSARSRRLAAMVARAKYHKKAIVQRGRELQAPLEMAWSCYEGGAEPCWECAACIERRQAGA